MASPPKHLSRVHTVQRCCLPSGLRPHRFGHAAQATTELSYGLRCRRRCRWGRRRKARERYSLAARPILDAPPSLPTVHVDTFTVIALDPVVVANGCRIQATPRQVMGTAIQVVASDPTASHLIHAGSRLGHQIPDAEYRVFADGSSFQVVATSDRSAYLDGWRCRLSHRAARPVGPHHQYA